jgi:glycosyltransferase involved in cell wall biosynthesis
MGKNAQRKRAEKLQSKEAERRQIQSELSKQRLHQRAVQLPKKDDKPTPFTSLPPVPGVMAGNPSLKMAAGAINIVQHIKGKKVIAFLQENFDCCSEKCILEYTDLFQKDNYACLLIPREQYGDILKYLSNYVVLFRTGNKDATPDQVKTLLSYISHLRSLGIRVVYYADDLIFWTNNNAPIALVKASDAVIVSNPTLKSILITKGQVTKPIIIVPTHIRLEVFDKIAAVPPKPLSNKFKILLTSQGRIGINHAFEICELVNEDPELAATTEWIFNCNGVAQIRSVVNRFRNLHKTYIDWITLSEYYALAKSVDLIIHPARPEDLAYMCPPDIQQTWLDSKSEVKYTLAGAARIPIISSPSASYKDAIRDGETGFIVNTSEEFVEKIKELKGNRALRERIGAAARRDIEQNYDVTIRYPSYRDAIIGAISPQDALQTQEPSIQISTTPSVFIPPIEGGPRSFYENMKRWLPVVTKGQWEVTENIKTAKVAIAIAFVLADEIMKEKKERPSLKMLYRLDGLPMDFEGNLEPTNLAKMQELFPYANTTVWQSQHCLKMWKERNVIPPNVDYTGPIIHNGVDLTIFKPEGRTYSFPGAKKYNFLNLNWSTFKHKRLDLLQETVAAYQSNPYVHFFMIGNYVSTSQIANVNFWKTFANVSYIGQMRNQSKEAKEILASIYRAATALIFTSEMEGSPNTVLEAMGCGCPVIYNDAVDIVPEILEYACLPLKHMDQIFDTTIRTTIREKMLSIAPKFSIEESCRKYVELF